MHSLFQVFNIQIDVMYKEVFVNQFVMFCLPVAKTQLSS